MKVRESRRTRWCRCQFTVFAAVLFAVSLIISGCTMITGGNDSGYRIDADFSRTIALYPGSKVMLMGISVGKVEKVSIRGDHIHVELRIKKEVPLPADAEASIVPLSLIGERNVVLSPGWHTGLPKLRQGSLIPLGRTNIPVEPDQALRAITDLANAINPDAVRKVVSGGAIALKDQGQNLNAALGQVSQVTGLFASEDKQVIKIAENTHRLAAVLDNRQQELGTLLDDFASATKVLSDERQNIATFLSSLVNLTNQGTSLLTPYQYQLPTDLTNLASITMTLAANSDYLARTFPALSAVGDGAIRAYNPVEKTLRARVDTSGTVSASIDAILDALGLPPLGCIPLPSLACS